MLQLDFSAADLALQPNREKTRRASISGVQEKVQLKRLRGRFVLVDRDGDYILKPVPRTTSARLAADIPVNEALTMDIASGVFRIKTADHELVRMQDGEYAYLTRRFDRQGGVSIRQEDLCQLSGRTSETHGDNYKYDGSYEEMAAVVRQFCAASAVENPKIFFQILFNYLFGNGDAHLKNFSLYAGAQGDYVLTPAYDLLNTSVHFPDEPTVTGLDLFADGRLTSAYEVLGFYSSADFIELGTCFGVDETEVREAIAAYEIRRPAVERMVQASLLSASAKELYLATYHDRLRAVMQ